MAETAEVLGSRTFNELLRPFDLTMLQLALVSGLAYDIEIQAHTRPDMSENDTMSAVAHLLEPLEDLSEEETERHYLFDALTDEAQALILLQRFIEKRHDAAKSALLEFGAAQGLSQFAFYGLCAMLDQRGSAEPDTGLEDKVLDTESALARIDDEVKAHADSLLTILDPLGVRAGIVLPDVGLVLEDTRTFIDAANAHAMSFSSDTVYPQTRLQVDTHLLLNDRFRLAPARESLLMPRTWERGITIFFGPMPEGEVRLESERADDHTYFNSCLEKIRKVGGLALATQK